MMERHKTELLFMLRNILLAFVTSRQALITIKGNILIQSSGLKTMKSAMTDSPILVVAKREQTVEETFNSDIFLIFYGDTRGKNAKRFVAKYFAVCTYVADILA